jgi:predicted transcriptional regulator
MIIEKIDAAVAEVNNGEFYTHTDVKKLVSISH